MLMWSSDLRMQVSMPSARQSTLSSPSASRSSLSHSMNVRPGIAALRTGTSSHERPAGDHEAADVLGEVAREALDLEGQGQEEAGRLRAGVEPHLAQAAGVGGRLSAPVERPREAVDRVQREPERLAHVAHGRPAAVRDDLAGDRGPVAAVGGVDVLDHLLAPLVLEVDVDVRRLVAGARDEALEEHVGPRRVDGRDPQAVAHRRVRGAPAPLAQDPPRAREADDLVDREEVRLVGELRHERQLVLEHRPHLRGPARRPGSASTRRPGSGPAGRRWPSRRAGRPPRGTRSAARRARSRTTPCHLDAARERRRGAFLKRAAISPGSCRRRSAVRGQAEPRFRHRGARTHRHEHVVERSPRPVVVVHVVHRDEGHARLGGEPARAPQPPLVVAARVQRHPEGEAVVVEGGLQPRDRGEERRVGVGGATATARSPAACPSTSSSVTSHPPLPARRLPVVRSRHRCPYDARSVA